MSFVHIGPYWTIVLVIYVMYVCVVDVMSLVAYCLLLLLWSCCCTLTFQILHFEVLTFWNVKIFLIGFLDELGNFKQKKVLPFAMQFFSHFTATDPLREKLPSYIVFCMYYTCLCFCVRRKMSPAENQSRGKTWYQEESLSHFLFPGADFYSS